MYELALNAAERRALCRGEPLLWLNAAYADSSASVQHPSAQAMHTASDRLQRFAPLLAQLFPELQAAAGVIESALHQAPQLGAVGNPAGGALWLKCDHQLPVAGSIKARGGIHEVLCFAEQLALGAGLIADTEDDYRKLASAQARELFAGYCMAVGSTGNLGLSIGIMSSALGFRAQVHMSVDAKAWKKTRLRQHGVEVVEHRSDYGQAVAAGRAAAEADPYCYFVDDESSKHLFMGYAVAALRLEQQLQQAGIRVDAQHPLLVYLPAGVGGAPGGITFGLKQVFGDAVHCFFAEPTQAPCMLLGFAGPPGSEPTSVYELGLGIQTQADGLAVGAASQLVCDGVRDLVSGVYTATDPQLFEQLQQLKTLEQIEVEPSAAIACLGPKWLASATGRAYVRRQQLGEYMHNSTHLAWLTGGSLVPTEEYQHYLAIAAQQS